MAKSTSKKDYDEIRLYTLKKCPYCFAMMELKAQRCDRCKKRVGSVNRTGFADKPVNWKAYTVSFLAWAAFAYYIWWAFFDR